jgi:PAS domain S-box-containing protein
MLNPVITVLKPDFLRLHPLGAGWLVGLTGLAVTAALAIIVVLVVHRRKELERQVAERTAALRETEQRLAHAMSLAQLADWEYEVASGLFKFSDRYYALHGTTSEQEGGNVMSAEHFVRRFVHPDDAHLVAEEIAKAGVAADPGYRSQVEARILRRDGEPRHVLVHIAIAKDAAGRTLCLRGANQDITERKKSEHELRKLWRAVEQTPAIVVITNVDGIIEYVNPKFVEITGYGVAEALGRNPRFLKSGVHPASLYKTMWDTLLQGNVWQGELCNKKKNGELNWEWASISPVRDQEGEITHFIAVKEEITERKRIAQELLLAKEAAESANRAKSEFLAIMSHEIRTPMNGLLGFVSLLQDTPLTDAQRRYLETIRVSGRRLLVLINDLLDFSKIEAGRMTMESIRFPWRTVVREVADILSPQIQEKELSLRPGPAAGHGWRPHTPAPDPAQPSRQCRQVHQKRGD